MESIHDYVNITLLSDDRSKALLDFLKSEEYDTDAFEDDIANIDQSNINKQCQSILKI